MTAVNTAFTAATGITIKYNLVDHTTFQDQITTYLRGTPDDVFTWFSGYRMRFFAAKGLATDDQRRLGGGRLELHGRIQGRVDR